MGAGKFPDIAERLIVQKHRDLNLSHGNPKVLMTQKVIV